MSGPKRYRKIPVILDAMQFIGDVDDRMAVYLWVQENSEGTFEPMGVINRDVPCPKSGISIDPRDGRVMLATHGTLRHVNVGDWIVRNDRGYFWPATPERFASQYEEDPNGSPRTNVDESDISLPQM
jgi:hypothetical protein